VLQAYADRLAKEDIDDVMLALEKLSEQPKGEYETALPDLGNLLAVVDSNRRIRIAHAADESGKKLFYFDCAYCGVNYSGHFAPTDPHLQRDYFCRSHYGPIGSRIILKDGEICGRPLRITQFESYDELKAKREAGKA
jgi:hypothetical protein